MRRTRGARVELRLVRAVRLGTMQLNRLTVGRSDRKRPASQSVQLPLLSTGTAAPLPVLDHKQRGTDFIRLHVKSVLNSPESTGMSFWSLNPYVGCEFGCSYCYARDTHKWVTERTEGRNDGTTDGTAGEDVPSFRHSVSPSELFEHRIYVKDDIARVIQRTLEPSKVGDTPIVIGTATDPYQPAERQFFLTRRVLEAFRGFKGLTISITTKSALVARDVGLLVELAKRHDVSVNISIISADPVLVRQVEPKTPLPHARLRALRTLVQAGIEAGILIAPILPGLTDTWTSLASLMEAARDAGARFACGHALRLGSVTRARFIPLLHDTFPMLAPRYERHYSGRNNASREYKKALSRRLRLLREAYGFGERRMGGEGG